MSEIGLILVIVMTALVSFALGTRWNPGMSVDKEHRDG